MSTRDEMEEQFFQALREIYLQMARLPFDELKARFTAVGERMAPQFAAEGHPDLVRCRRAHRVHSKVRLELTSRRCLRCSTHPAEDPEHPWV